MTTRISYRKGGEEKFKEITDKPQFMYLDNVAPPKAEEVEDYDQRIDISSKIESERLTDGKSRTVDDYEE